MSHEHVYLADPPALDKLVAGVALGVVAGFAIAIALGRLRIVHEHRLDGMTQLSVDEHTGAMHRLAQVGEELAHRPAGSLVRRLFSRGNRAPAP